MFRIISLSIPLALIYFILIYRYYTAWKKLETFSGSEYIPHLFISIIIAFRNESEKISENFKALMNQNYPHSSFEIIYINDHSVDNSPDILQKLIKNTDNIRLIHLSSSRSGKKAAIMEGVKLAKGELLLFTDADCYPLKNWIRTMAGLYNRYKPVMISGPVLIRDNESFFSKFQALEFLSLTGSGAGSFGIKDPILCNAANMGFAKKIYLKYMNEIKQEIFSGDDIFMLLALKKTHSSEMLFLKSFDGVVYTDPAGSVREFLLQRIRWVSKSKYYRDSHIIFTALSVMLINILIPALIILSGINKSVFPLLIFVLFFKISVDYIFLRNISIFFNKKYLLRIFIPSEILYLPYAIISAIAGNILIPVWKGRKLRNDRTNRN